MFFSSDLTDLTGKTVVLTYVHDIDPGNRTMTVDSDVVEGGPDPSSGGISSTTSARIAIDGVERVFGANRLGSVGALHSDVASENRSQAGVTFDYTEDGAQYIGGFSAVLGSAAVPERPDLPFSASSSGSNRLEFFTTRRTGGGPDGGLFGFFGPETVVVSPYADPVIAPVSLPAAAGLLIIGLGAIGAPRSGRRAV